MTERANADAILRAGFLGGWGDLGFGVYFWTNEAAARAYAEKGGWDGMLEDPVLLEVRDASLEPFQLADLHPDWDPTPYQSMLWRPMDEDDRETPWQPGQVRHVDAVPVEIEP